jgi:tetratricopeptide (TPR) repeat protein
MLPAMIDLGREAVRAALAVASDDAYAHCVDGMLSSVAGDLEHAGTALREATRLDPASAVAHAFAGFNAAFFGKAEETAPAAKRALALRPNDPARGVWLFLAGAGELLIGRTEQARPLLEASTMADAQLGTPKLWLAAANALEGNARGARSTLNEFEARYPSYRIRDFQQQFVQRSRHPNYRQQIERVLEPLRSLGIPD